MQRSCAPSAPATSSCHAPGGMSTASPARTSRDSPSTSSVPTPSGDEVDLLGRRVVVALCPLRGLERCLGERLDARVVQLADRRAVLRREGIDGGERAELHARDPTGRRRARDRVPVQAACQDLATPRPTVYPGTGDRSRATSAAGTTTRAIAHDAHRRRRSRRAARSTASAAGTANEERDRPGERRQPRGTSGMRRATLRRRASARRAARRRARRVRGARRTPRLRATAARAA